MVQFLKTVRVTCETCRRQHFDAATFEDYADIPKGWKWIGDKWGSEAELLCSFCFQGLSPLQIDKLYVGEESVDVSFDRNGKSARRYGGG